MIRHDCEEGNWHFLVSGHRVNGEVWACPVCGRRWVHVCDEAEGCAWFTAEDFARTYRNRNAARARTRKRHRGKGKGRLDTNVPYNVNVT